MLEGSQLVEPPDSQSPAAVAHEFSNVAILGVAAHPIHGPEDDLFEQNITVTIVRTADAVIVYNPIPLSKAQMREHLPDAAHYWIVLPSRYHHLYVDPYLDFLPPGRSRSWARCRRACDTTRRSASAMARL